MSQPKRGGEDRRARREKEHLLRSVTGGGFTAHDDTSSIDAQTLEQCEVIRRALEVRANAVGEPMAGNEHAERLLGFTLDPPPRCQPNVLSSVECKLSFGDRFLRAGLGLVDEDFGVGGWALPRKLQIGDFVELYEEDEVPAMFFVVWIATTPNGPRALLLRERRGRPRFEVVTLRGESIDEGTEQLVLSDFKELLALAAHPVKLAPRVIKDGNILIPSVSPEAWSAWEKRRDEEIRREFGLPETPDPYAVGDRVAHPKLGVGTVEACHGAGTEGLITVRFGTEQRMLMLKWAPLTKVE